MIIENNEKIAVLSGKFYNHDQTTTMSYELILKEIFSKIIVNIDVGILKGKDTESPIYRGNVDLQQMMKGKNTLPVVKMIFGIILNLIEPRFTIPTKKITYRLNNCTIP